MVVRVAGGLVEVLLVDRIARRSAVSAAVRDRGVLPSAVAPSCVAWRAAARPGCQCTVPQVPSFLDWSDVRDDALSFVPCPVALARRQSTERSRARGSQAVVARRVRYPHSARHDRADAVGRGAQGAISTPAAPSPSQRAIGALHRGRRVPRDVELAEVGALSLKLPLRTTSRWRERPQAPAWRDDRQSRAGIATAAYRVVSQRGAQCAPETTRPASAPRSCRTEGHDAHLARHDQFRRPAACRRAGVPACCDLRGFLTPRHVDARSSPACAMTTNPCHPSPLAARRSPLEFCFSTSSSRSSSSSRSRSTSTTCAATSSRAVARTRRSGRPSTARSTPAPRCATRRISSSSSSIAHRRCRGRRGMAGVRPRQAHRGPRPDHRGRGSRRRCDARLRRQRFRDGAVPTSGTAITRVLPAVSRFSKNNDHATKKQTVLDRLGAFFERYFGLS